MRQVNSFFILIVECFPIFECAFPAIDSADALITNEKDMDAEENNQSVDSPESEEEEESENSVVNDEKPKKDFGKLLNCMLDILFIALLLYAYIKYVLWLIINDKKENKIIIWKYPIIFHIAQPLLVVVAML